MLKVATLSALIGAAYCHSWADSVGGGSYRGAQGANDLIKQRYYCPLSSLSACQPPASTGVVLTAQSMRPCRTDFPTPQRGSAVAGQPMYVHWAGNGHTGSKGAGTCVSLYIAPYALDPDFRSFRQITSCLPFSHDADITDAYVTVPSDLASGQYTVFWLWDFSPFWFSSCSDITVTGSSGPAPVTTTKAPGTTSASASSSTSKTTTTPRPASTTVVPVSTSSAKITTLAPAPSNADCKSYDRPNAVCQSMYGAASYCVSWVMDKCGRSRCVGAPAISDSKC